MVFGCFWHGGCNIIGGNFYFGARRSRQFSFFLSAICFRKYYRLLAGSRNFTAFILPFEFGFYLHVFRATVWTKIIQNRVVLFFDFKTNWSCFSFVSCCWSAANCLFRCLQHSFCGNRGCHNFFNLDLYFQRRYKNHSLDRYPSNPVFGKCSGVYHCHYF